MATQKFGTPGGSIVSHGEIPAHLVKAMKRRAQSSGPGVQRLGQTPFNPLTQNLDIPTDYAARNTYKRHFFKTNPIVGNSIELHSEFALSDFHLEHEDEAVEEFLNNMLDECNFYEHMLMASMEWWLIGEQSTFSFFDDVENPSRYTGFALLDPNRLKISSSPFVQGRKKENAFLDFDPMVRKIVQDGMSNRLTADIYQNLPPDVISYCRSEQPMPLSSLQLTRMKRGSALAERGESALERVFPLLMLKDELRNMQRAVAKRAINPIEIWKIGEQGDPADQGEIDAFREILQQTFYDVNSSIVYHHALNCQVIGAEGRMPSLWTEFDSIDNEVCAGLLINKGLILGDSSTFASDIVRYDILINRYLMFRTKMERWILRDIIDPILKIHEIYVPESKVKSMRFRQMCGQGRPLNRPSIRWDKQSLRDENSKLDLLTKLVEKKLIPESTLIRMLNIDPLTAAAKVEDEMLNKIERHASLLKRIRSKGIEMTPEISQILGFEGVPEDRSLGGGSMPTSIDSGPPMGDIGNLPEVIPGATADNQTGAIPTSDGIQGAPSESQMPIGMPT